MALRWKKHPAETGLRRVGAGPRGSDYWDGKTKYATVAAHSTRHTGMRGWWWYAKIGDESINTCNIELPDESEAKERAAQWVKERLAKAPK